MNPIKILFILFSLFTMLIADKATPRDNIETNATLQADQYNSLGSLYYRKHDYDKALEFFNKSLQMQLATIGENNHATAKSYNNIGLVWYHKREYDKAIEFYKKALKIQVPKENYPYSLFTRHNLTYAFRGLGSKYKKEKNYTKAIDYYSRALLLHKKILSATPKKYSDEVFDDMQKIIQTHQITQPQKAKETYTKSLNYFQKLFKQDKKSHAINYIKMIIQGVEQFDLDSNRLDKAKEILATLPDSSEKKGLLLQIEELEGGYGIYILILSILFLGGTVFYFKHYKNPLVVKLTNPKALLTLNIEQLKEAKIRLSKIDRFENILTENSITKERYKKAIEFEHLPQEQKSTYLSKRIFAKSTKLTKQSYMMVLNDDFPLNVKQFILFFSDQESIDDMMGDIKNIPQYRTHILFILSSSSENQMRIYQLRDGYEKFVIPHPREITQILLGVDGAKALAKSFSAQLALTQISPYQLGGGVNRASMFFGRAEIVSHILGRENSNYIIIGSRQIGKSSLLKAIEREYHKSGERAYYISLNKGSLVRGVAKALKIKAKSVEELEGYIMQSSEPYIFLIDEADRFIQNEQKEGYKILNSFRKLSEEGRCSFILAGFWEVYRHAVLDYQSPLKNFGETIELGALEVEACREMITKPMKQLGLRVEDDAVEEILERTGRRANLIAIICNNIIKHLGKTKKVIKIEDAKEAIREKNVYELFEAWRELTPDEPQANRLDRIIVYATVKQGRFALGELIERLKSDGLEVDIADLERGLDRLKVSYTLDIGEDGVYFYRLPLFREYILRGDYVVKLREEIRSYL